MKLKWCWNCNVPLISEKCELCGNPGVEVPISRSSDPRPAWEFDLKLLKEVVERDYGAGCYSDLLPNGDEVVLFGRAPYMDTSYEVIADGAVLGHLFFDLFSFSWKFKPSEVGARRIGHRMERINCSADRGEVVSEASDDDPDFKLTLNGIACKIGGKYVVTKVFKGRKAVDVKQDRRLLLRANEMEIELKESRAALFINRMWEKYGKLVLSFSGGKDSAVLLNLAEKSKCDYLVYFNDTGIEMPETIEQAERADIVGSAGDSFWRYVPRFGPPARDYRWCCKVLKLVPTYKALKGLTRMTLVGQRRFESLDRMRSKKVWMNEWLPGILTAAPINDWTALDAWLYVLSRKIEVNKLYFIGFERIGCYLCPSARISDFLKVKERHPDLWGRWEDFLLSTGWSEDQVKYGLWRWVDVPKRFRMFGEGRRRIELDESKVPEERLMNLARTSSADDPAVMIRASFCTGCGVCSTYCDAIEIRNGVAFITDRCSSCGLCNKLCPLLLHWFWKAH
ncbi:MAG: phosphoadenosine phosphosulfate reductase family protein [Candidatus Methanodesulfokora sp.]